MGMFGLSQEDVQQQQEADNQKQAFNIAGLTNGQMNNYNGALTGQMLGRGIDAAFGTKDPQMERANKLQTIEQQTEQQAPFNDDPLKHMQLAISNLQNAGLYKEAQNAFDHYKEFAGSQAQTTNANAALIKANKDGAKKLKSIQYGADDKSYNSYDDGSSELTTNQFVQKSGSDPALITLQSHRNDLITQLKNDPTNEDIKQQIVEISKNIANSGQSFQYIQSPDGKVYAANRKDAAAGMTEMSAPIQPQSQAVQQPMPQGQSSSIWQGGDISPKDMQKLQRAAQKGNMDARSALDAYSARDQSQPAQAPDNQQPTQGAMPQQAPVNISAKSMLTDATKEAMAFNNLITNKPPALPKGYKGKTGIDLADIYNKTTELQQKMGLTNEDLFAIRLNYDTAKPALAALQKQAQPLQAFENTLLTNIDSFQNIAKTLDRTDSQWLNVPIVKLQENTGNTTVVKLNVRLKALQTEGAKIMSGSMGNTVLSDYAQKEQELLTNKNMSINQMIAATNELADEVKNARMKSMGNQIKNLTKSLTDPKLKGMQAETNSQSTNRPPLSSFRR